jgi:hypothetical protein
MLEWGILEKLLRVRVELVPGAPSFAGHVERGSGGILFLADGGSRNVL